MTLPGPLNRWLSSIASILRAPLAEPGSHLDGTPSGEDLPRYWVFISYSHYDRRVARWCRDQLARQSVPVGLRALVQGASSRIGPIFLDEDSAAASPVLSEELKTALRASRHLLIICSPFAAASSYVSDEVRYFQALGRGHRILCLVASGVPNATDDGRPHLECFPLPLRVRAGPASDEPVPAAERPLAALMGDEGPEEKRRAVRQLTAGVLGVSEAVLLRGERRRRMALSALCLAAAADVMVLLVLFVLPWHTYSREYVRRNGTWQEVGKISHGTATKVGEHYEFTRRGALGRPTSVRIADGFGRCTKEGMEDVLGQTLADPCNTSRACEVQFNYGQDGSVVDERLLDQYGTLLETLHYVHPDQGLLTAPATFFCSESHSGIDMVQFQRYGKEKSRQAGFDWKITFQGSDQQPRVNNEGAYGIQFVFDDAGHQLEKTFLSADGMPQTGRTGYAVTQYKRRADGVLTDETYLSPSGDAVTNSHGYAAVHMDLDSYGRRFVQTYLDAGGKPVLSVWGMATTRKTFGSHGEELTTAYFDAADQPTNRDAGYSIVHSTYDSHGNETQFSLCDTAGKPTDSTAKISSIRSTFDSWGNPVEVHNFGPDGKSAFNTDGYVTRLTKYDRRGNSLEERNLGLNGEPLTFALTRYRFDEHNRIVGSQCFDSANRPAVCPEGMSEIRYEWDANGNETAQRNFGVDGQPTVDNIGISVKLYQYDQQGLKTEERDFGLNNQPAITNDGDDSITRYEYDPLGRVSKESFFDGNGHSTVAAYGYSSVTYEYDPMSRIARLMYLGPDGQPLKSNHGFYGIHREYDNVGHVVLEQVLDAHGNPALDSDGYAAVRYVRDKFNNDLSGRYLGVDGNSVLATADHVAGWNAAYDQKGQQLSYEEVGLDGTPVPGQHLVAHLDYTYNAAGDRIGTYFKAANGVSMLNDEGIGGWLSKYDDRHQEVERQFIDTLGKPVVSQKLHYAMWRKKYDARGRVAEASFFDTNGHLTLSREGYAIERYIYDQRGNNTEATFFNENGQPSTTKEAAKVTYTYNSYGWQTERRFYGVDGQLINNPQSGRAIVRTEYDTAGRMVSETSLDQQNKPVNRLDKKYFRQTVVYDASGKPTYTCTTTTGRPISPCTNE